MLSRSDDQHIQRKHLALPLCLCTADLHPRLSQAHRALHQSRGVFCRCLTRHPHPLSHTSPEAALLLVLLYPNLQTNNETDWQLHIFILHIRVYVNFFFHPSLCVCHVNFSPILHNTFRRIHSNRKPACSSSCTISTRSARVSRPSRYAP